MDINSGPSFYTARLKLGTELEEKVHCGPFIFPRALRYWVCCSQIICTFEMRIILMLAIDPGPSASEDAPFIPLIISFHLSQATAFD